jgi:hypothetical protein
LDKTLYIGGAFSVSPTYTSRSESYFNNVCTWDLSNNNYYSQLNNYGLTSNVYNINVDISNNLFFGLVKSLTNGKTFDLSVSNLNAIANYTKKYVNVTYNNATYISTPGVPLLINTLYDASNNNHISYQIPVTIYNTS